MKVVLTTAAKMELREIGDWIAQDSPLRAISFVDELEAACLGLDPDVEAISAGPRI